MSALYPIKARPLDYRHARSCARTFKKAMMSDRENPRGLWRALIVAFFIVAGISSALHTIDMRMQGADTAIGKSADSVHQRFFATSVYAAESAPYAATLLLQPHGAMRAEVGSTATVQLGFKNIGTRAWRSEGGAYISLYNRDYVTDKSIFAHTSWLNGEHATRVTPAYVAPGQIGFITFTVSIPVAVGIYRDTFQLAAEDTAWVSGGSFVLVVEAMQPAVVVKQKITEQQLTQPVIPTPQSTVQNVAMLCEPKLAPQAATIEDCTNQQEPNIRVGLYATAKPVALTNTKTYRIMGAQSGETLFTILANQESSVWFIPGANHYTIHTPGQTKTIAEPVRFESTDAQGIFTITTLEQRPAWNTKLNDNQFRGVLEFHHAAMTGKTWMINELPLDSYLKGLVETSNSGPMEYQKALLTAARTYVLWHYLNPSKHADEHFTVDATYDQVYRGYGAETRLPNVATAVAVTRGQVVAYDTHLVVTPYYTQSDGRTRGWTEVWGGSAKPWLVSVAVPEDLGKPLLGHGVGMSAQAAVAMAQDEGKDWKTILRYFYTGTAILPLYR